MAKRTKRGRGRPAHKPTAKLRDQVELLRSMGGSEDTIARAIGISAPTLREYYGEELKNGAAKKWSETVSLMARNAKAGNAAAARKMEEIQRAVVINEGFAAPTPVGRPGAEADKAEPEKPTPEETSAGAEDAAAPPAIDKTVAIGKKDQARADAEKLVAQGGKFAPPPGPRLAVNNG